MWKGARIVRMVWKYGVHIVIMACNEYEGDKLKCARYWPDISEEKKYGMTHVLMVRLRNRLNT